MSNENAQDTAGVISKANKMKEENNVEISELTTDEKEKRLAELLLTGRRALKVSDVEKATDALSEATELSALIYGENHENTFESLYYYGMATLELAKLESQLLKNPNEKGSTEGEVEMQGNTTEAGQQENDDEDNSETDKEDGEDSSDEDEDENDSMKLSWEILETARCIAAVKIEALEAEQSEVSKIEEWNLKLADVLILLGEHSISDGKYAQAREDLDRALNIQNNFLPSSSRKIAQTYILMGNACSSDANYDETVQYFEKTKNVLLAKNEELQKQLEGAGDEAKAEIQDEMKELEEMITGMDTMIADAISSAAQVEETKRAIKAQYEVFTSMISQLPQSATSSKEANDISSLVRRPGKRPASPSIDTEETKKTKEENSEL